MKYLIIYENFKKEPETGDYVICKEKSLIKDVDVCDFISNNIGRIFHYINNDELDEYSVSKDYRYIIKYDNVPANINKYFRGMEGFKQPEKSRRMSRDEIIYWSKNREDLEAILDAKKYNL